MRNLRAFGLSMLLALALAAVGWAHPAPAAPRDVALFAAFEAAGGTRADICGSAAGHATGHAATTGCEACLLTATAALPPAAATWTALQRPGRWQPRETAAARVAPACHPGWLGRAPPPA